MGASDVPQRMSCPTMISRPGFWQGFRCTNNSDGLALMGLHPLLYADSPSGLKKV